MSLEPIGMPAQDYSRLDSYSYLANGIAVSVFTQSYQPCWLLIIYFSFVQIIDFELVHRHLLKKKNY